MMDGLAMGVYGISAFLRGIGWAMPRDYIHGGSQECVSMSDMAAGFLEGLGWVSVDQGFFKELLRAFWRLESVYFRVLPAKSLHCVHGPDVLEGPEILLSHPLVHTLYIFAAQGALPKTGGTLVYKANQPSPSDRSVTSSMTLAPASQGLTPTPRFRPEFGVFGKNRNST